jgi:hypothetical protein
MAQLSPEQLQAQLHQAQLHQAQQAVEQHLHQRKINAGYDNAAQQAIDLHKVGGDHLVKAAINTMMDSGKGDPEFVRNVGRSLYHQGRPDLAQIHSEAADGW